METIRLSETYVEEAVLRAADVLRDGGVILYPTDTLYGLGANAFSDSAVAKVYAIKGRDEKKPVHCIVAGLDMAAQFAEVNETALALGQKFLPGPLTIVLRKRANIEFGIGKHIATIGVRIPDNEFCLRLAKAFGAYTTTSANIAGETSMRSIEGILSQFGDRAATIDLVIDAGELPQREPSTVVDISTGVIKILREGAIPASDILAG